jgi:hypothetical protein
MEMRKINNVVLLFSLFSISLISAVHAGTYWVSPNGTATTWAQCQSANDPGSNYCSLDTANRDAVAGDTVYIEGGTYYFNTTYDCAIYPRHTGTGTGTGRIIYASAPNNAANNPPMLQQTSPGARCMGIGFGIGSSPNSYIKVDGITFKNFTSYMVEITNSSSHNEITNCTFTSDKGFEGGYGPGVNIAGSYTEAGHWCTDNWFHHNYFSKRQDIDPCAEGEDLIRVGGSQSNPTSRDDHNTFEDNYLEYGGHSIISADSYYCVIRNNIMHNEPWITGCVGSVNEAIYDNHSYDGKYGHRCVALGQTDWTEGNYNLLQGNRIGFASNNPGNAGASGVELGSPKNIIRYNYIYAGMGSGVVIRGSDSSPSNGGDNRIFNNTIYYNGHGWDAHTYGHGNLDYNGEGIAQAKEIVPPAKNVIKNNILYGNSWGDICQIDIKPCSLRNCDTVVNNLVNDPQFVNPDLSDPLSQNIFPSVHGYSASLIPDLSLKLNSPAIDTGTNLTTAIGGSGSAPTKLVVADAMYFQDGTWGSDLARNVTMFPDWIAIGTVTDAVKIQSIDYVHNTITLAAPTTWSNGANIWLYSDSSGKRVLNDDAPDMGAYECPPGRPPKPPARPRGLKVR